MNTKTKDSIILIGQVLAHAKYKNKVISSAIISYMNKLERRAIEEGVTQQMVDKWFQLGKDKYNYSITMGEKYGANTRNVKYLV